jgi:pimeloyl-ACP methyl ester carboxylesterase
MAVTQAGRTRTSGGELAYREEGEGPAVVLIHGFPQSSHVWRHAIPVLSSRFRVIVPDQLGTGDSERPAGVPLDLVAQAGYVGELLDGLGVDRCAVIGHSHGGGIAQLLALDRPGVDAMVLLAPSAFDAWPTAATREIQDTPADQEVEELVAFGIRASLRHGMVEPDRLPPEDVAAYLRTWSGPDGVASFFRFVRQIDGTGLADREADLGRLEIPVLIFWGEQDPFYPSAIGERLNEAIPTSTLGLLPGCGHFLLDEAAETLVPMIFEYLRARFLHAPHGHGAEGIVTIQLERKAPWVEMAGLGEDDDEGGEP